MKKSEKSILIIGHRGASAIAPANTLKAFEKAIQLKADYVEFDIHISKYRGKRIDKRFDFRPN